MQIEENTPGPLERVLAYSAVTVIGLSVASFFVTLIAAFLGVARTTLASGFWPVVTWVGYVGLPVGFGLVLVLVLVTRRRRIKQLGEEQNR